MRVVLNTLATLKPKTGVGHYAAHLAAALHRFTQVTEFPGPPVAALMRRGHAAACQGSEAASGLAKSLGRAAAQILFRAHCRLRRFDLYHEPNFLPFQCEVPTVITVHDLSALLHPQWHPADRVRRHESQLRGAASRAAHLITVSEAVRAEVITHLGVPAARVTAVHNGVGPEFFASDGGAARRRLSLPDKYLLFVGTIEPRKNLMTVLRAYCELPADLREQCPLVLAGGWGWRAAETAEYIAKVARHRNVVHLGYVADADRPGLYAGARALVSPSHYEGFGLPPLEMLAAGGMVVASAIAAHREVLGPHAHYVNSEDMDGWQAALQQAIDDDEWLKLKKASRQDHARCFSWDRCVRQTAAVYRTALSYRKAA